MKLQRTVRYNPELFNLIPLVNVLFLLLALVSLSNTFVVQPGIAVKLPVSSFALSPQQNPQIVSIIAGPAPVIYFRDEKVSLAELNAKLVQAGASNRALFIRADGAVPYDTICQVVDAGLKQGYSVDFAASHAP
jgi:biopolymer transport protein ExbD